MSVEGNERTIKINRLKIWYFNGKHENAKSISLIEKIIGHEFNWSFDSFT